MNRNDKIILGIAALAALTAPVFTSGLRRELTFPRWLWGHTVFGPWPLYVPRETAMQQSVEASVDEFGIRQVDGEYLANKRLGYSERDIREWITPDGPLVKEYCCALWDPDPDTFTLKAWYFVCSEFDYSRQIIGDLWFFPEEMLQAHQNYSEAMELHEQMRLPTMPPMRPAGDCEDFAATLTSLLIAGGADAHMNVGHYDGTLHAWVTVNRNGGEYLLEPTLSKRDADRMLQSGPWIPAGMYPEYSPEYRFNDTEVYHLTKQ